MLSRAFTKPRRNIKDGDSWSKTGSILEEYEDCIVGFMDDLPLISCGNSGVQITLREVLRASVGVIGEGRLGMTEKVVLLKGKVGAVKRFRKVVSGRSEFGRRVERLAQVSTKCEYLVPLTAYLYAKRIKFVLCDYYPMGSLADLLAGGRERGHTALEWNQRLTIILNIGRAITFIHAQCPPNERNMQMNVHGNIKSSNVMINIDFTAHLSDYGFTQLAEPPLSPDLSQKSDIYNYGIILLDLLGGSEAPGAMHCIIERKQQIKEGTIEFFEFSMEEKERRQALKVLDIALACTNGVPEARPSMEQILLVLGDIISNNKMLL